MAELANNNANLSFQKGLEQVQIRRRKAVRSKLFTALDLQQASRTSFRKYVKGIRGLSAQAFIRITQIFHDEGITEIWGDDNLNQSSSLNGTLRKPNSPRKGNT